MNIGAGLMAGANFASGFQQGQQQRLQENMQQLAFQNAQLQEQQNALNMKRAQAEADYSMSLFTTGIKDPVTGQTIGGNDISPQQYSQAMGRFAATNRDPAGAMQYFTQGANFQSNQEQQQVRAAQVQNLQAQRQAKLAQEGAQAASMFPPTEQGAQQFLAYMQANGGLQPQEYAALQTYVKQAGPNWQQGVIKHGMTIAQQYQLKNTQDRLQQEKDYQQQQLDLSQQRLEAEKQHWQNEENAKKNGGDKPFKLPTAAMTDQAYAALGQAIGQGVDSNGQFKDAQFNSAAQDIAEQAAALAQRNPALTYRDAINQIIQSYKTSGMLPKTPNAPGIMDRAADFIGIHTNPGTSTSFKDMGTSVQNAIPAKKGMTFIPGKIYVLNGEYGRFNGRTFDPIGQ